LRKTAAAASEHDAETCERFSDNMML
jgi:hypothetical protein